jgi:hypothetical protein
MLVRLFQSRTQKVYSLIRLLLFLFCKKKIHLYISLCNGGYHFKMMNWYAYVKLDSDNFEGQINSGKTTI